MYQPDLVAVSLTEGDAHITMLEERAQEGETAFAHVVRFEFSGGITVTPAPAKAGRNGAHGTCRSC
ncbi:hypothetical protein SUDANB121_05817 [Nocardiopsis dassonvillei]|uniref:hypothetical protein n=1 Tax=Nocardiopsis dassonvillei TaxID=2014 RepID=UPI003F55C248